MNMLANLIIVLIVLGIWHFVYEAIIAPALRFHLRNELFIQRDRLRKIFILKQVSEHDLAAFDNVHSGINLFLDKLDKLNLDVKLQATKVIDNNPEIERKMEARLKVMAECKNEDILQIFENTRNIVERAFFVNMGGGIPYLVPVALVLVSIASFKKLASELLVANSYEVQKLMPDTATC